MNVLALVAAYNEESTIASVVTGVRHYVPDVIVVDDGSTDRTAERAGAAGAIVLRHDRNRGKGAAIRTGLAQALAGSPSHVLFIDGDLQHDPNDIPALVAAGDEGYDLVIAERSFVKGSMPTSRFYSNRIGSWILSRFFIGTEVSDSQSGFRLVRSECLRRVTLKATGYEIETEMLIKLTRCQASLYRITIPARYDGSQSKLRSFRDTVRTCLMAVRFRYLDGD